VKTLRQHVEEAERIMSIGGVKTLIQQKGLPAPIRVDAGNRQLEYAVSVRVVICKYDRTGYAEAWLKASDDVAGTFWHTIPEHSVCPLCLSRMPEERRGKGRQQCALCGAFVRPKVLRGLVSADLRKMATLLKLGEIPVRGERG
jgi:rubredoxin